MSMVQADDDETAPADPRHSHALLTVTCASSPITPHSNHPRPTIPPSAHSIMSAMQVDPVDDTIESVPFRRSTLVRFSQSSNPVSSLSSHSVRDCTLVSCKLSSLLSLSLSLSLSLHSNLLLLPSSLQRSHLFYPSFSYVLGHEGRSSLLHFSTQPPPTRSLTEEQCGNLLLSFLPLRPLSSRLPSSMRSHEEDGSLKCPHHWCSGPRR